MMISYWASDTLGEERIIHHAEAFGQKKKIKLYTPKKKRGNYFGVSGWGDPPLPPRAPRRNVPTFKRQKTLTRYMTLAVTLCEAAVMSVILYQNHNTPYARLK
jgi:hypothetical protein